MVALARPVTCSAFTVISNSIEPPNLPSCPRHSPNHVPATGATVAWSDKSCCPKQGAINKSNSSVNSLRSTFIPQCRLDMRPNAHIERRHGSVRKVQQSRSASARTDGRAHCSMLQCRLPCNVAHRLRSRRDGPNARDAGTTSTKGLSRIPYARNAEVPRFISL
jgi:hypothetical protein